MKILGFRTARYIAWFEAVREATSRGGFWASAWKMARAVVTGRVTRKVWRERMRYGCLKCPIFSRGVCRLVDGERELGCGCYAPFLALVKAPYRNGCWVREYAPDAKLGWDAVRSTVDSDCQHR